jgi:uncharacterized membrane protein
VLTIWVIYKTISVLDNFVNDAIELLIYRRLPGVGFILIVLLIVFIGFVASTFLMKSIIKLFELLLKQTRFTRWIYSSLKELFNGFMNEKKRFDKPVLVMLNQDTKLHKIGFITQNDLTELGINDLIAVYLPHSYNFSGDLYLVPSSQVRVLDSMSSSDAMKFIVSGGMVELDEES